MKIILAVSYMKGFVNKNTILKSSLSQVFFKFFNKVTGLQACNLIKKGLQHSCFPVKFEKFLRPPFLKEYLRWLLLK